MAATAIYLNSLWGQISGIASESKVPQKNQKLEATEKHYRNVKDLSKNI